MSYKKSPLVGIIMGSKSDARIMIKVAEVLDKFGIKHEDQIVSAHRTPTRLEEYAKHAKKSKFRVIIAGAGGAAHLPGMIASFTNMPVIGVPIMVYNDKQGERHKFSAFGGLDSLVSMSEMPTGSPVACVGVNKAENAGIYARKDTRKRDGKLTFTDFAKNRANEALKPLGNSVSDVKTVNLSPIRYGGYDMQYSAKAESFSSAPISSSEDVTASVHVVFTIQ